METACLIGLLASDLLHSRSLSCPHAARSPVDTACLIGLLASLPASPALTLPVRPPSRWPCFCCRDGMLLRRFHSLRAASLSGLCLCCWCVCLFCSPRLFTYSLIPSPQLVENHLLYFVYLIVFVKIILMHAEMNSMLNVILGLLKTKNVLDGNYFFVASIFRILHSPSFGIVSFRNLFIQSQ